MMTFAGVAMTSSHRLACLESHPSPGEQRALGSRGGGQKRRGAEKLLAAPRRGEGQSQQLNQASAPQLFLMTN